MKKKIIYSGLTAFGFALMFSLTPKQASADCTTTQISWYCNKDANGDLKCEKKAGTNYISRCKKPDNGSIGGL